MRVIIDLPEKALKVLGKNAEIYGRSRKKHMEMILSHQAALMAENQKQPKTKKP